MGSQVLGQLSQATVVEIIMREHAAQTTHSEVAPEHESSYASVHNKITCTPVQESSHASDNNNIEYTPLQESSQDDREGYIVVTPWGDHYKYQGSGQIN